MRVEKNEKVAITCLSLGQSYNGIAQTDSARPYLLEGLKYCEENTVLDSIRGRLLTDLASCYMIEGGYPGSNITISDSFGCHL